MRPRRRLPLILIALLGAAVTAPPAAADDDDGVRSAEVAAGLHIRRHIELGREAEQAGDDALAAGYYERALQNFNHPDLGVLVMTRQGRAADYDEAARRLAEVGGRLARRALERDRVLLDKDAERLANVHRRPEEGGSRDPSWHADGGALLYYLYSNRYQDFHDLALAYAATMNGGEIKEYVRYWSREKRFRSLFKYARGRLRHLEPMTQWPAGKFHITPQERQGFEVLPRTQRALGEELARQIDNWIAREETEFRAYVEAGGASKKAMPLDEADIRKHMDSIPAQKGSVRSLKNAEELLSVLRFYHDEAGFSDSQNEQYERRLYERAVARGDWLMEHDQQEDAKDYYRFAGADDKYLEAKTGARAERKARKESLREWAQQLKSQQQEMMQQQ